MIEDAWFVLAPLGHREYDNQQKAEWLKREEPGIQKIAVGPDLPLDMWVCDFCNGDIEVEVDGVQQIVPMLLSNALCWNCVDRELMRDGNERQRMARELGMPPMVFWSNKGCPCPPCKEEYDKMLQETGHAHG